MIYIVTNDSTSTILIERLGKEISSNVTINLTDQFDDIRIFQCYEELKPLIESGALRINNGTKDLTIQEALDHTNLESKYEDSAGGTGNGFTISSTPPVGSVGIAWFNTNDNIAYQYCGLRNKWLSINRTNFVFGYPSSANGVYMDLAGFRSQIDGNFGYKLIRNATIISILCNSYSGYDTKNFDIKDANGTIFSFAYNGSLFYSNENVNININQNSLLRLYINYDSTGGMGGGSNPVNYTSCQIEITWRYDIV